MAFADCDPWLPAATFSNNEIEPEEGLEPPAEKEEEDGS